MRLSRWSVSARCVRSVPTPRSRPAFRRALRGTRLHKRYNLALYNKLIVISSRRLATAISALAFGNVSEAGIAMALELKRLAILVVSRARGGCLDAQIG